MLDKDNFDISLILTYSGARDDIKDYYTLDQYFQFNINFVEHELITDRQEQIKYESTYHWRRQR